MHNQKEQLVAQRAVTFLNTLHLKNQKDFGAQFIYPGDKTRWPFLNVLPGAVIIEDSAKLIKMHDGWFAHPQCAFRPYNKNNEDGIALDRKFIPSDLDYCEFIAKSNNLVRCGANAHVVKEAQLGNGASEIITTIMHLSMIFAFEADSKDWWVTQINNTPLDMPNSVFLK